jgi:hypothetical protein
MSANIPIKNINEGTNLMRKVLWGVLAFIFCTGFGGLE